MRTKVPQALLCLLLTTSFLSCVKQDDSSFFFSSERNFQKLETRSVSSFKLSVIRNNGSNELRKAQKAIISTLADSSITVKIFVNLSDSTVINCKQIVCTPNSYQLKMETNQYPYDLTCNGISDLTIFKSATSDNLQLISNSTLLAFQVKTLIVEETDGF